MIEARELFHKKIEVDLYLHVDIGNEAKCAVRVTRFLIAFLISQKDN
jgi:hypothetical protein